MAKVLLLADHTANKTHVCAICLENDWNQHQDNMEERSAAVEYHLDIAGMLLKQLSTVCVTWEMSGSD